VHPGLQLVVQGGSYAVVDPLMFHMSGPLYGVQAREPHTHSKPCTPYVEHQQAHHCITALQARV
jgi:hypothetical protein